VLEVQIVDRIGGHAQFGTDQQIRAGIMRAPGLCQNGRDIAGDIGRGHSRRGGGHADKAVSAHVIKGMPGGFHRRSFHTWLFAGSGHRRTRRFEPVLRRAHAELRQSHLHPGAGDLAPGLPAIDSAAGPGIAIARAEFLRRKRRIVRLAPLANEDSGLVHRSIKYPERILVARLSFTPEIPCSLQLIAQVGRAQLPSPDRARTPLYGRFYLHPAQSMDL